MFTSEMNSRNLQPFFPVDRREFGKEDEEEEGKKKKLFALIS